MATSLKQAVHQNLKCPVCLSFFKDPKILTCSHTFCKSCLEIVFESHPDKEDLSCPTCREETPVPGGDVDRLQTNITVRSLVEDVETQGKVCSNCKPEDKTPTVVFCNECGKYLCDSCRIVHSKWANFSSHSIVGISDVSQGRIPQRRSRKCQKHPNDDAECFCLDCTTYVCFKCGILEHAKEAHKVLEAGVHETELKNNVDELVSKADAKVCNVEKYVTLVGGQRKRVKKVEMQLSDKIDEAFEEAAQKLKERKEVLKEEVGHKIKELDNALEDMEKSAREQIVQVNKVCGLVKKSLQFPLQHVQKEALTTHDKISQQLEQLLSQNEPEEELPTKTAEEGERLDFRSLDGLMLGQLRQKESKWVLQAEAKLPFSDSMAGMTVSPKNKLVIGWHVRGICTCSVEGILQETVLKTVKVRALQSMPDGGYVIRDTDNRIFIYTELYERIDVAFETLDDAHGGHGGVTVNKDGLILTSYSKFEKIQVFKPEGGKAVKEIPCNGFQPMQIFAMKFSPAVVTSSSDSRGVRVIDDVSGATIHSITRDMKGLSVRGTTRNSYSQGTTNVTEIPYSVVCKDDSVIIAWVKHSQGLVNINQYSGKLKHIKNILTDFKITKPSRQSYYLQQFKTGEIALCTTEKLYIFRETWE